jgi:hypothetical protein
MPVELPLLLFKLVPNILSWDSPSKTSKMSFRRPYGTPRWYCEISFPTLKCGANNHRTYGALTGRYLRSR